jgi:hypothetical protein
MSNVKDAQGNVLNNPGPGCGRYKDENSTVIDWFDNHPRPVEEVEAPVEPVEKILIETPVTQIPSLAAGNTTSNLPQTAVAPK